MRPPTTGDGLNRVRRHLQMRTDQAVTLARWRLSPRRAPTPFDGDPRFALLTVNFATLRYLKLMLLTLTEQTDLELIRRIVIVHHPSRDGGEVFLRELAARVSRIHVATRTRGQSHAKGMRAAIRALRRIEASAVEEPPANVLLFCDPDVVFRNPQTIRAVAHHIREGAALLGEFRGPPSNPDIQASFVALRRDAYERSDVLPWVSHGSPTLWMQRSVVAAGLAAVNFPSNGGAYVLHRGRGSVEAVRTHAPHHPYATVAYRDAHFMGVAGGAQIWAEIEARHAHLLEHDAERELLDQLVQRLEPGDQPRG